jgi:hypothetical protein
MPGDFKYDLLVRDAETGEQLGDEDPVLVILPLGPRRMIVHNYL